MTPLDLNRKWPKLFPPHSDWPNSRFFWRIEEAQIIFSRSHSHASKQQHWSTSLENTPAFTFLLLAKTSSAATCQSPRRREEGFSSPGAVQWRSTFSDGETSLKVASSPPFSCEQIGRSCPGAEDAENCVTKLLCAQGSGLRVFLLERSPFSLSFCFQQQDVENQPSDVAVFLLGMVQKVPSLGRDRTVNHCYSHPSKSPELRLLRNSGTKSVQMNTD